MKKKILIIGLILLLVTYTVFGIISYADDSKIFVSLSETYLDKNGNSLQIGYGIGDATQLGAAKIWHLATYASASENAVITAQRNLYCVKANYGDTWNTDKTDKVTYNLSYDIQAERKAVFDKLTAGTNAGNSIVEDVLNPSKEAYRQILWILDNSFIEGQTNKEEFLASAGIVWDERYQVYAYDAVDGYNYQDTVVTDGEYSTLLTEQDINAVQKAAIWYYTNYVLDENTQLNAGELFNKKSNTDWLTVTTDNGTSYNPLSSISADRDEQARVLYNYLIDAAENNKTLYTSSNNYALPINSLKVNNLELEITPSRTYDLATEEYNNYLLAGPINISESNDGEYDINISVTNTAGNAINYEITNAAGTKLQYNSIKDLIEKQDDFYIKVLTSVATEFNIAISTTTESTSKTLWLDGEETVVAGRDAINLQSEQPIVEVERTTETKLIKFFAKPVVVEKEFDLALRKYITKINNTELSTLQIPERIPTILGNAITSGTTATYKHKKDPVFVETGDIVTYQIRIYNEGEKKGYASQIIDQLPAGLIYNPSSKIVSKDPAGNDKNEYTVTYDTQLNGDNKIVFNIINTAANPAKDLNVYEAGNIDYETLEIQCKVIHTAQAGKTNILTNVAWISGAYDTTDNVVATDRDSQTAPENSPNVNKESMENYKGNTSNKNDLTDSTYFYKGQQDDDDFEKLYVQIFDLSLRKFISAVDGVQLNGRAPQVVVTPLTDNSNTTTTAIYNHPKTPVASKIGDKIIYTIRIYNEGEIDGYASEVKDYLPPHLEFVRDSQLNNRYGWSISDDGRIATTTYLSDKEISKFNGTALDYEDIQIECKILNTAVTDKNITNIAEISKYKYGTTVVPKDIDSESDNMKTENNIPTDEELPNYKKDQENNAYVPGNEDDDDFEKVYVQIFDLSLRKFITAIDGQAITGRQPVVDVSPLKDNSDTTTTAIYNHPKTPLIAKVGSTVVYTIRVYNEGEISGYASEVKDYLPPHLEFVEDSDINQSYGWTLSTDKRVATTTYLANKEINKFNGTTLDYEDLKIECKILGTAVTNESITNIAEISEYKYDDVIIPKDIDSSSDNMKTENNIPEDTKLPDYKKEQENDAYVPGNEDDDDFEKVYVKTFDLALRKFITKVQETEVTTRVPQVKIENGKISYEHPKDPVLVHVGDRVEYTIRVYNEGEIDGYASEIADDIPGYLEYLPQDTTNTDYMWKMYDKDGKETEKIEDAIRVKTQFLSMDQDEDNLLVAFDGTDVDYKDIKIAFKVKDPNSNQYIITNHAQITDDTDENGDEIKDKDSIPDEWNENEDDQDIENVKVQYFDLALLKYVTKVIVIEDGAEKITETGYNGLENPEPVVKVELHRKKLSGVVVKFGYGIKITNEGDIAGYAKEITDYIPEGLKFVAEDNPTWVDEGNNVISTKQLEGTLLQPGESATVEVILTWINGENNLMEKTNTAEISIDDNEYDIPDRDSTPDNKEEGEDDIDIAKVILTISTGVIKTYFKLALGLLVTIAIGIIFIKRFVS